MLFLVSGEGAEAGPSSLPALGQNLSPRVSRRPFNAGRRRALVTRRAPPARAAPPGPGVRAGSTRRSATQARLPAGSERRARRSRWDLRVGGRRTASVCARAQPHPQTADNVHYVNLSSFSPAPAPTTRPRAGRRRRRESPAAGGPTGYDRGACAPQRPRHPTKLTRSCSHARTVLGLRAPARAGRPGCSSTAWPRRMAPRPDGWRHREGRPAGCAAAGVGERACGAGVRACRRSERSRCGRVLTTGRACAVRVRRRGTVAPWPN